MALLPEVWFEGNDMLVKLSGVKSSTMGSTSYLNSSTGLRVSLYDGPTTSSAAVLTNRNVPYVSGTNGNYRIVIQSTESTALRRGNTALAVYVLSHSGLNGKWWLPFRVENVRTQ